MQEAHESQQRCRTRLLCRHRRGKCKPSPGSLIKAWTPTRCGQEPVLAFCNGSKVAQRPWPATRSRPSLRHIHLLPLVQHDLLAAEQRLAPHLAVVGLRGAHELHDPLLDVQLVDLFLAQRVHRHELAQVVASHGEGRRLGVEVQEQACEHLQGPEVVLLELEDVLRPELGRVDEAPGEDARLQLPLVPVKVAHLLDLRANQPGHVADLVVELGVAPLLELQLLHGLQDALLHDVLAQCLVCKEVLQHSEAESNSLLCAVRHQDLLDLLDDAEVLHLGEDLRVEGEHPDRKGEPVDDRPGSFPRLHLRDLIRYAGVLPHEAAEHVGLEQVGERLKRPEVRTQGVRREQDAQHGVDVVLAEEAGHVSDDGRQ
mmetsp:Transcript_60510/g.187456  ORF Transcript_60510/g.187456 Transcript_60510/m.187456 type:complete len:371 (+) Transcript_60510:25-1137(+)